MASCRDVDRLSEVTRTLHAAPRD
ncbi:MAG: hypothetical protein K0S65_2358, partial [Labilithrix sp.]|nr:hypothetical protein [Labilithrix sp.]